MSLNLLFTANASATTNPQDYTEDQTIAMASGAAFANADVDAGNAELNRLIDVAAGLDNLTLIGDNCPKAGKVELALFDTAVNMMVAGENIDMPQIATESNVGRSINTQSIKTIASSVWNSIKKLMVRIRDAVVKFFKDRWGESARLRKRLKALIAKCDKKSGMSIEEKDFEVSSEFAHLYVNNAKVDTKDIDKELEKFHTVAEAMYDYYIKKVNAAGEEIKDLLTKFDSDVPFGGVTVDEFKLTRNLTLVGLGKVKWEAAGKDENAPKGHKRSKVELLGNHTLLATESMDIGSRATASEVADVVQRSRVSFANVTDKKKVDDKGKVKTMPSEDVRTMANSLLEILDIIDGYEDSKEFKEIGKLNTDIHKAGDAVEKSISGDSIDKETVASGKAIEKLAGGFANWSSAGFTGFASHFNRTAAALISIGNKSLDQHK